MAAPVAYLIEWITIVLEQTPSHDNLSDQVPFDTNDSWPRAVQIQLRVPLTDTKSEEVLLSLYSAVVAMTYFCVPQRCSFQTIPREWD